MTLTEEREKLLADIATAEAEIQAQKRNIYWYKKRLRLLDSQIKETSAETLQDISKNLQ